MKNQNNKPNQQKNPNRWPEQRPSPRKPNQQQNPYQQREERPERKWGSQ